MPFTALTPSQYLKILSYQDIDHFRQGLRGASVDFVPLAKADAPVGQAILSLPGCDVHLLQTFPRIVHAMFGGRCTCIMLSMKDSLPAIFNGKEAVRSSLQFAHGPVEYRAVEREPGRYAALIFSPLVENRGWPEADGEFLAVPISRGIEMRLRKLISLMFATVSQDPDLASIPGAAAGLVDSLLEALDQAFDGHSFANLSGKERIHHTLRAARAIDDLVDSGSLDPIYSEDIASKLGVSVRTLTNLMVKTTGMSLHRYIRTRRLWMVRRQLLTGDPNLQIKEIALASGFWHLGDFAAKYFSEFGELPSSTQARR